MWIRQLQDLLQNGHKLRLVIFFGGLSTMLRNGKGVHFTLDPSLGEFIQLKKIYRFLTMAQFIVSMKATLAVGFDLTGNISICPLHMLYCLMVEQMGWRYSSGFSSRQCKLYPGTKKTRS